jgi:thymidylate synthase (FAD)
MVKVLDEIGSIELLESFGNDLTVVNAARVSFAKEVKEFKEGDQKLINYLVKHNHISPFFHPQIRFRLKMPIFVAREWFRHTIGFARNEVSRRYVDDEPEIFIPSELRGRDKNKKQGSKDTSIENNEDMVHKIRVFTKQSLVLYNELLDNQVAPEVARGILPQNMYTEFIETASLYAYMRLCALRLDPQAQKEIREYASIVSKLLEEHFPASMKAFYAKFNDGSASEST